MNESTIDSRALLRRTLLTAGAMVGACVLLVGTLTLVAVGIVSHASSASRPGDDAPGPSGPAAARMPPTATKPSK